MCQFCPPAPPVPPGKVTLNRKFIGRVEYIEVSSPQLEAAARRRRIERYGLAIHFGARNLFVPGEGLIYVAPSMVAHYIDAHAYEPPAVFWEAVMKCPEMRSEAYRKVLILNGPTNEKWARVVAHGF